MIKAIVTDLDGVIRHFPSNRDAKFENQYELPPGSIQQCAFGHSDFVAVLKGEISDAEWRKKIASRIYEIATGINGQQLIKEWSSFPGIINWGVMVLFQKYQNAGVLLGLLTNATDALEKDLKILGINNKFDLILNSSNHGLIKPDSAIFQLLLDKMDIIPSEVVFIDDSPQNIEAAQTLGIPSHLFSKFGELELFLAETLKET
jgi:putative hydrolase of the HAD superfamily